eukprot:jgi/Chlat1/4874/Chrsp31S08942
METIPSGSPPAMQTGVGGCLMEKVQRPILSSGEGICIVEQECGMPVARTLQLVAGFIRAMLGDVLSYFETPVMTAVRLILLNQSDQISKYVYPSEEDKQWKGEKNYDRFIQWRVPTLQEKVKPVPGLSEAAAMCRARVYMDTRFLAVSRGHDGELQASLWEGSLDEGHDTLYTTVWQQATIGPNPYGPNSATFFPDVDHRGINVEQWADQFRNMKGENSCSDLGEVLTPGYLESSMVSSYELRDKRFRIYPDKFFWQPHVLPVAIQAGFYKVWERYTGLANALLVDGTADAQNPTFCVEPDASGRLMVCDFIRMTGCGEVVPDAPPHHAILSDKPANVVGIVLATPMETGDAASDAIAKVRWCAAAELLRGHAPTDKLPDGYVIPPAAEEAVHNAVYMDKTLKAQLLRVGETGWADASICQRVLQEFHAKQLPKAALLPMSAFSQTLDAAALQGAHTSLQQIVGSAVAH